MDPIAVLHEVETGLTLAQMALEAGRDIAPIVTNLIELAKHGTKGTVTPEMIAENRRLLDAEIDFFNQPMPDDPA